MRSTLFALACLTAAAPLYAADDDEQRAGAKDCAVYLRGEGRVESLSWSGACKDGHAEGTGVLEWKHRGDATMSRYEGGMHKGRWHGEGYVKLPSGYQYEGGYRDGLPHGSGTEADHGSRYDGSFVAGKADGVGKIVYHLGGRYEGQWKDGKFHGKGTATYAGGRTVTAEFIEGRRADQPPLAEESEKRYRIANPGDWSHSMVSSKGLALSRSYDELSPEEKQTVRSMYLLDDDDEPPFPVKGLKKLYQLIGEAQQVRMAEGKFFVHVLVDSEGTATSVDVFASPDPVMNKFVAAVVGKEKFKPGVCQGKPCAMRFPISVMFTTR